MAVADFLKETPQGVVIALHVIPNASKCEVVGEHNGALKLKITAPPVDGKANKAIIVFFSELLEISKSQLEILKGDKAKNKSLLAKGLRLADVEALLKRA